MTWAIEESLRNFEGKFHYVHSVGQCQWRASKISTIWRNWSGLDHDFMRSEKDNCCFLFALWWAPTFMQHTQCRSRLGWNVCMFSVDVENMGLWGHIICSLSSLSQFAQSEIQSQDFICAWIARISSWSIFPWQYPFFFIEIWLIYTPILGIYLDDFLAWYSCS